MTDGFSQFQAWMSWWHYKDPTFHGLDIHTITGIMKRQAKLLTLIYHALVSVSWSIHTTASIMKPQAELLTLIQHPLVPVLFHPNVSYVARWQCLKQTGSWFIVQNTSWGKSRLELQGEIQLSSQSNISVRMQKKLRKQHFGGTTTEEEWVWS